MKIAIIGAGPVGLFSAICLAQDKHEIHLYEKSTLPVDKACGEGLLHLGVTLLKKYDIDIKKTKPIRGLNFYSPKGHLKKASFLDSTGLGIRRLHLSESLLKYVKKYPNITLFERTKIHAHVRNKKERGRMTSTLQLPACSRMKMFSSRGMCQ